MAVATGQASEAMAWPVLAVQFFYKVQWTEKCYTFVSTFVLVRIFHTYLTAVQNMALPKVWLTLGLTITCLNSISLIFSGYHVAWMWQLLVQLAVQELLHHQDLCQIMVKSLRALFLKCDNGKISVKHAFSLVALSRMNGIHKYILEGYSFWETWWML